MELWLIRICECIEWEGDFCELYWTVKADRERLPPIIVRCLAQWNTEFGDTKTPTSDMGIEVFLLDPQYRLSNDSVKGQIVDKKTYEVKEG